VFEVASIKPANSGRPGMSIQTGAGRFKAINATVAFFIQYAYGIKDFQLMGGPSWIRSDIYDIDAKSEIRAEDREFPAMMQALLMDRFQLRFHREARELPVYVLVAVKRGPKLAPASEGENGSTRRNGAGQLVIKSGTVGNLASTLSNIVDRKVLDKTGLTGNYDMTLTWTPDDYQPPPLRPNGPPPDPNNPSIFTALQEQLGLKLESAKGPLEVLVIDSVSKPSKN
jgi:uncharacterized protein (TIGR03435 family)